MSEILQVRSEAYFSPSEIFVNDRDYGREAGPYPVERANIG